MRLKRVLTMKMSGDDVKFLQTLLKQHGFFKDRIDGYFGQNTLVAVSNFQRVVSTKPDGVIGPITWNRLLNYNTEPTVDQMVESVTQKSERYVNDIPYRVSFVNNDGLRIYDYPLTEEEYYRQETRKNTIWLHHTAGGSRPDWTIGGWEKDYQKDKSGNPILDSNGNPIPLRVATQYVVGRKSSSNDDDIWDGKVFRTFDDKFWSYHLGINSKNSEQLNSRSIGIEICNYGPLTLGRDGRFYNYVNKPINDYDVVELSNSFRGYKYYEKYTDLQLENTRKLILHLKNQWGIEIESGIYNEEWFEYNEKWFSLGGLRSHTQVRRDKFDVFPQKELIQMLNSL
jgi:peptidoglycan hydrolase-like protein with peptidoglycan-binding domain